MSASSISSTIVRTSRVLDALTSTNASAIERMSPTSRTTISSPFLSSAACAAIPARRWASDTGRSEAGEGVKRRAPAASSPVSVEAPPLDLAHDVRAGRARRSGGPSRRRRAGRSTTMSRRGMDTRSTRHPGPGGSAWTSPARSTTTTVARWRVSSSRRHVGMLATASAPSTRNSSRPGAASASSVSAVTDGRVAFDLDRRRLDAVDARRPRRRERETVGRRRHDLTALLPRIAGDDEQHPVEAELAPGPRRRRRRARRARGRTCRRTRPAVPSGPRHRRESTGAPCLHSGETFASSPPVASCR